MRQLFPFLILLSVGFESHAQSLEIMPGTERIFADVQWLKTFDETGKWSLFSRTRATIDYEENTSFYTGGFLNRTFKPGIGVTAIGRISSNGGGAEAGLHFFKMKKSWMLFSLAYIDVSRTLSYSFFNIFRYYPPLGEKWKLFTALELFTNLNKTGHAVSFQGVRVGLDRAGYQFGPAVNLYGFGTDYGSTLINPGFFIRKQF